MITVEAKNAWESAGTCTFIDYTWGGGASADNIPIQKRVDAPNQYRIKDPLCAVYGTANGTNFEFELNDDGSISVPEGYWTFKYWNYQCYYDSTDYGPYCYIEQDGNTYRVHHLLTDGSSLSLGSFEFIWNR